MDKDLALRASTLVLAVAGCGAPSPDGALFEPPPDFPGFPHQATCQLEETGVIVYAEANYVETYERELDVDVVADQGVLPVWLSIHLKGQLQDSIIANLEPDRWAARLYLPDGTVLAPVAVDKVTSDLSVLRRDQIEKKAFHPRLLSSKPLEGYLFFDLKPRDEFFVEGDIIIHDGDVARPARISDSLITFNVTLDDKVHPLHLGLRR